MRFVFPAFSRRVVECGASGTGRQFGVENALLALKAVGQSPDGGSLAANHDHLRTQVMVEVDVGCGEDHTGEVVLLLGEAFGQAARVVIVEKRDGSEQHLVCLPLLLDEVIANEIADELGAVAVLMISDLALKPVEERFFDGDGEADDVGHGQSLFGPCYRVSGGLQDRGTTGTA